MKRLVLANLLLLGLGAGCATSHNVHVAPIQVAPIRMTMDVNVNVHQPAEEGDAGVASEDDEREDAQARTQREDGARPRG